MRNEILFGPSIVFYLFYETLAFALGSAKRTVCEASSGTRERTAAPNTAAEEAIRVDHPTSSQLH